MSLRRVFALLTLARVPLCDAVSLQDGCVGKSCFWASHILNAYWTGPANKDLGNVVCDVGFIAFYCFGQQPGFSNYNSEEHVDGTVFEQVWTTINSWGATPNWQDGNHGGYLSCCPPKSKTNTGDYYRCNYWTTEANDNCHTPNLPWNDGKLRDVGGLVPSGSKPVGGKKQWMWSFPSEGEGTQWFQGLTRRVLSTSLANMWKDKAGGCAQCSGKDIEDPCYGKCINAVLDTVQLVQLTHDALGDFNAFPNYGIPGCWAFKFAGSNMCMDLGNGNSMFKNGIDIWDCNGMVNQAWYWGDYKIQLGGHNAPGMCLDLPGGDQSNGNKIWLWECIGGATQEWIWDGNSGAIQLRANPKKCIDVPGGNAQAGNLLWLWDCNGGASQKWEQLKGTLEMQHHQEARKKPQGRSWMHEIKDFVLKSDALDNFTMPTDFVPWYEREEAKKHYFHREPPRTLLPLDWTGYNTSSVITEMLV
jgi:hypothetical protein